MLFIPRAERRECASTSTHTNYIYRQKTQHESLTLQDHTDTHTNCIKPKQTHICMYGFNEPPRAAVSLLPLFGHRIINSSWSKGDRVTAFLINHAKGLASASGGTVRKKGQSGDKNQKNRSNVSGKTTAKEVQVNLDKKKFKTQPSFREGGLGRSQFPSGEAEDGGEDRRRMIGV